MTTSIKECGRGRKREFVVGVSGGRGRVINNCWWNAREFVNTVRYNPIDLIGCGHMILSKWSGDKSSTSQTRFFSNFCLYDVNKINRTCRW